MKWLGIEFTEGEEIGGRFGPYRQSEREDTYHKSVKTLLGLGFAYRCFCSPDRIEKLRESNRRANLPPRYDRHCRRLTVPEIKAHLDAGTPFVVRLAIEPSESIEINDLIRGSVRFDGIHLDDPILLRSDGSATGLLAGAVDDYSMQVTHIFRGDEWLPSTPYQFRIFQGLGRIPEWGHLSLLVDEDHTKLSKRTAGLSIHELRAEGVLPEALCRYLVGLGRTTIPPSEGWNLTDLAMVFDPTGYRPGEIVYSRLNLFKENQEAIRRLGGSELLKRFLEWAGNRLTFAELNDAESVRALQLASEDSRTFHDCLQHLKSFLERPVLLNLELDEPTLAVSIILELQNRLPEAASVPESLQGVISSIGRELGVKGRELYLPIRLALTGLAHGPRLIELIELLGNRECHERFNRFINYFSNPQSTV